MKIPILICGYNRKKKIKKLILSLKNIKPKKIYINLDGPKNNEDKSLCLQTRNLLTKEINWTCQIFYHINRKNLGCKKSMIRGINWFFKKEIFGIILEDDCIPKKNFFLFFKKIYKKFSIKKQRSNIGIISGFNPLNIKSKKEDFIYTKYAFSWGWATWRENWLLNSSKISTMEKLIKNDEKWNNIHENKIERAYWKKIAQSCKKKSVDSWAYPWMFSLWHNSKINIIPKKNLIINIGIDDNSTHANSMKPVIHSKNRIKEKKTNSVDEKIFYKHYKPFNYLYPWRLKYILRHLIINNLTLLKYLFLKKKYL